MRTWPTRSGASMSGSSNSHGTTPGSWTQQALGRAKAELLYDEWVSHARWAQYGRDAADTWLVLGGRGAGKTRLGAEWVNSHVRGFPPLAERKYGRIALIGETLADVRDVMIEGPSGIVTLSRHDRPRFEASRRRLVWDDGSVALMFSSEDPESLRGHQFEAAWWSGSPRPETDPSFSSPMSRTAF
ncbi:phage terminase large subunit-like protein [Mesorhizobium sp. BE184]|nr:phage terminase large subunit-like protein [Mesorhizobium sp. BE184]